MAEGMDGNQSLTPLSDSSRKDECSTREKDFDNNNKYKVNYREMGVCVILNMENFDKKFKKEQRKGTDKDAEELKKVFENIGFKVMIEKDATIKRVIDVLKGVAKEDHSQRSCFVCVVLSHGDEGKFCCYDDFMDEEYLFNIFKGENCRGLVGKPKLFFFQACRGDKKDPGVKLYSSSAAPSCRIPVEADFLCHYSTAPGYVAWRHPKNGSCFIQSLCEILEKYWKEQELMHILTRVNYKVAYEFEAQGNKEMPYIVSKLTKDLYLKP